MVNCCCFKLRHLNLQSTLVLKKEKKRRKKKILQYYQGKWHTKNKPLWKSWMFLSKGVRALLCAKWLLFLFQSSQSNPWRKANKKAYFKPKEKKIARVHLSKQTLYFFRKIESSEWWSLVPCLDTSPLFNHLSITARWCGTNSGWIRKVKNNNKMMLNYWAAVLLRSFYSHSLVRIKILICTNIIKHLLLYMHAPVAIIWPYHQQIQILSHEHESGSLCRESQPPCISPVWESRMPEEQRGKRGF